MKKQKKSNILLESDKGLYLTEILSFISTLTKKAENEL